MYNLNKIYFVVGSIGNLNVSLNVGHDAVWTLVSYRRVPGNNLICKTTTNQVILIMRYKETNHTFTTYPSTVFRPKMLGKWRAPKILTCSSATWLFEFPLVSPSFRGWFGTSDISKPTSGSSLSINLFDLLPLTLSAPPPLNGSIALNFDIDSDAILGVLSVNQKKICIQTCMKLSSCFVYLWRGNTQNDLYSYIKLKNGYIYIVF